MPGQTSKENGKKGGRKKGSLATHTLEAQESKKVLIELFRKRETPVFTKLIDLAEEGDLVAMRELLDRVFGKAKESLDLTSGGEILRPYADTPTDKLVADIKKNKIGFRSK